MGRRGSSRWGRIKRYYPAGAYFIRYEGRCSLQKPINSPEMNIELIAKVCHEVNKAFCEANGDHSQQSWNEASDSQKENSKNAVSYALAKNPTPDLQHEAWVQAKVADGWVHGEVKDAIKKTHPSILPYSQLPHFEQIKDQ